MINRIRDIRQQKGMTLAEVAAACSPPTTAQTIGRLETGMRNLSLVWMNRIGAALGVEPELLVKGGEALAPQVVARLVESGAEALSTPRDAILPTELGGEGGTLVCLSIDSAQGEYRSGDQLWLRQVPPEDAPRIINRDVLVPRSGGRFAFGRLIDRQGTMVGLLPPGSGQRQIVVDKP
ncbi:MAG: helix-turn-helix transcriptional regulator, partial [Croceibacterium sp.]